MIDHAFEEVVPDVEIKGFRKELSQEIFMSKFGIESLYEKHLTM